MHYFDCYPIQSRIRKVHPGYKLGWFVLYTVLGLSSHSVLFLGIELLVFLTITVFTVRISLWRLLRLMAIPAGFVLLGSLSVVLELNPVHPLFSLNTGAITFGVGEAGLQQGLFILFRSFSGIAVLYALVLNTSISDMIYVLRKLNVPEVVLDLMVLVYRNIFILSDTAQRIYIAQKSRMGHRNLKTSLRSTAQLGGSAFILAGVRAEQLFHSMESRGYTGRIYSLPAEWETNKKFIRVSVILFAALLGIFFLIGQRAISLV
ncbi:cobalt ABC transporter, inner membrane subunit CbiQ [Paludibacter propionicigenes WB4]|uniref:Cobalt ABC transporter, inner membrane subunit CbiQ n=1 Tax=Paludibacter propionicigenes (strain DSM 17365 / JCM 13257 / WB4) TaxID=694427 RepID=E4T7K0_PALPW|nr:cobalt ECF transporter T component CbiQ [Paludibacter propionicigenes]ADQ80694.1 cobalt ABC transporter, inner membrane subunit CbiQ [Paludibacter propionicigenes WB4]